MKYPPVPKVWCGFCGAPTVSRVQKSEAVELQAPVTIIHQRGSTPIRATVTHTCRRWRVCASCGASSVSIEVPYQTRATPMHRSKASV